MFVSVDALLLVAYVAAVGRKVRTSFLITVNKPLFAYWNCYTNWCFAIPFKLRNKFYYHKRWKYSCALTATATRIRLFVLFKYFRLAAIVNTRVILIFIKPVRNVCLHYKNHYYNCSIVIITRRIYLLN